MPRYVVLLEGSGPPAASAQQLGGVASAMLNWLDELREAGVLVSTGVPDARRMNALDLGPAVHACIVVQAGSDDDAHALAATCPPATRLVAAVVPMRDAAGATW